MQALSRPFPPRGECQRAADRSQGSDFKSGWNCAPLRRSESAPPRAGRGPPLAPQAKAATMSHAARPACASTRALKHAHRGLLCLHPFDHLIEAPHSVRLLILCWLAPIRTRAAASPSRRVCGLHAIHGARPLASSRAAPSLQPEVGLRASCTSVRLLVVGDLEVEHVAIMHGVGRLRYAVALTTRCQPRPLCPSTSGATTKLCATAASTCTSGLP